MKKITGLSLILLLVMWLIPLDVVADNTRGDVNNDGEVNIADVLNGSKSSRQEMMGDVIANLIEITNNNLPNQVDDYCECKNLSEEKNYLIYNLLVDESLVDLNWYKAGLPSTSEFKQGFIKSCKEDPIQKHYFIILAEVGYGIIHRYKGSKSGKIVELILTPQDIKDISK